MANESLLRKVYANDTWDHEQDFVSEWLSDAANMEQLGKIAGLDLVDCEIEVRTNQGWADMLCREGKHGENTVVETQFGPCDMNHIGRLLEYGVDLEATHCIMVAEKMTYSVLEFYNNISIWRANCRLHLVEFSVLEEAEGEIAGVLLRKPEMGLLAKGHSLLSLLDLPVGESKDNIDKAVLEMLKTKRPPPKKVSAKGAKATCQGEVAKLPRQHGKSKRCISVALWPSNADEAYMANTMAHACKMSTGVLLVLLPRRSERVCQLLSCMQAISGAKMTVTAQRWKWQATKDGTVDAIFNTIELDQGDTKAAQAIRDAKQRRDFWNALARAVEKGSVGSILASNAKKASSRRLGYKLGRAGFNLAVIHSPTRQCYFVELHIHSTDPGQTDNWFEQLQSEQKAISNALAGEFELVWSKSGRLRTHEAVLRCKLRKHVTVADAHLLQNVPALASAVHKVEQALLQPILDVEEFRW